MTRLLVVLLLALAGAAATVSQADAKAPCRNAIFNDWYHDGQIASTYPIACYRDALRHVRTGDRVYTSLEDDIRAALQAALARLHGKKVADQVGHRFSSSGSDAHSLVNASSSSGKDEHADEMAAQTTTLADPAGASSGSGVPVPLLVLGGLALALIAAGGIGMLVRRRRGLP